MALEQEDTIAFTKEDEASHHLLFDLEAEAFKLQQTIDEKQLKIKHLTQEIDEAKANLKVVGKEIDHARDTTTKSWERTGYGTLKYTDLKPTGLSKRTTSGGFFSS